MMSSVARSVSTVSQLGPQLIWSPSASPRSRVDQVVAAAPDQDVRVARTDQGVVAAEAHQPVALGGAHQPVDSVRADAVNPIDHYRGRGGARKHPSVSRITASSITVFFISSLPSLRLPRVGGSAYKRQGG